jgi:SAM-dependent methyltransferase
VARLEQQAELAWASERRLLAELGLCDGQAVLELGCGSGALLARLAAWLPGGRLLGVEPDAELAAAARTRVPGAKIVAGEATSIPLEDNSVDFALARFVFQHLPDPTAAAGELQRVLRPGGTLAVIEVDGELWGLAQPSFPRAAQVHAKAWASLRARGGDRMIGRRLTTILAAAGYADVDLRLYGYHSDALGLDAFAPILDPAQSLTPFVEDGTITPGEFGLALEAYRRFRADPDAFVLLVGLIAAGRA